ncbi:MAG: hypothetical protein ABI552_01375, partial [Casimicrobiaceae bacterium]
MRCRIAVIAFSESKQGGDMLINARLIGVLVGAALVGGCACMPHGGENKLPTISCAAGASCAPVELAIQCQGGDCRIQDVG